MSDKFYVTIRGRMKSEISSALTLSLNYINSHLFYYIPSY